MGALQLEFNNGVTQLSPTPPEGQPAVPLLRGVHTEGVCVTHWETCFYGEK